MKIVVLLGAAMVLLLAVGVSGAAQTPAPTCQRSVPSAGLGRSLETDDPQKRQGIALAGALSDAIARVRGVSITAVTTLRETVTTLQTGTSLEVTSSEAFTRELQSRIAGFVTSYEVTRVEVKDGGLELGVAAEVCTDLRFGVSLMGSGVTQDSLAAALTEGTAFNRWSIAVVPPVNGGDLAALYDLAFRYGLDLIATGQFITQDVANRSSVLPTRSVTLQATLIDLASGATMDTFSASQTAVGRTAEDAEREAALQLGKQLASRWGRRLSPDAARGLLTFTGFKRPGSPAKLREVIATTSGVIGVEGPTLEGQGKASFSLKLGRGLCDVAKEVARSRVVTMWLRHCSETEAEIAVERD